MTHQATSLYLSPLYPHAVEFNYRGVSWKLLYRSRSTPQILRRYRDGDTEIEWSLARGTPDNSAQRVLDHGEKLMRLWNWPTRIDVRE